MFSKPQTSPVQRQMLSLTPAKSTKRPLETDDDENVRCRKMPRHGNHDERVKRHVQKRAKRQLETDSDELVRCAKRLRLNSDRDLRVGDEDEDRDEVAKDDTTEDVDVMDYNQTSSEDDSSDSDSSDSRDSDSSDSEEDSSDSDNSSDSDSSSDSSSSSSDSSDSSSSEEEEEEEEEEDGKARWWRCPRTCPCRRRQRIRRRSMKGTRDGFDLQPSMFQVLAQRIVRYNTYKFVSKCCEDFCCYWWCKSSRPYDLREFE